MNLFVLYTTRDIFTKIIMETIAQEHNILKSNERDSRLKTERTSCPKFVGERGYIIQKRDVTVFNET